ncbi:unnamed protein product [Cyprideis torosa]|uniref:Uncharacterized protein n=1 Tax=Cyprideis torosa TaxID=163714 RepID=A0A7R8WFZ5_9CRUS|nr:unnamed protein product [Cyprideis torosa]CAG0891521.1 unnamed protein product [Cyprideis torosa]
MPYVKAKGGALTTASSEEGVLSKRNFIQARSTMLSKVNWVQTLGLAIIAGLIWFQVDRTEHRLIPSEQEVIHKERASGAYRLSSYYLAKTLGELPLTVCLPLVYHVISYPMMGLHSPSTFFILLGVLILSTIVAQSIGLFISASCMDLQVAIAIAALYTLATQLFAGYLVTSIPTWLEWGRYCSIVHYAYESMQIIEFASGPPVLCSQTHSRFPVCEEGGLTIPAEDIINEKHSSLPLGINILILTGFLITFRLLAYAVLSYLED